ncbi:MAG: lipid-A-disaccharide synthase [Myxococcales bacterium]|nr:lipid-A-disaccharide synthase [Myxococcales bacterium]
MSTVLLSVGDVSGDAYAGDFVGELRALLPDTRFLGMGGRAMRDAGVELLVDQRELATSGLFELLPDLHRIVAAWRRMAAALHSQRPDLVVLVDSSGFNLPFARRAFRRGVPTFYYVSPQVWGWRSGRIRKLARVVAKLAVIFPFELEVYAGSGLSVEYVGHPLVERLEARRLDRAAARRRLGISEHARVVTLLPGSRRGELRHILPLHLEVARVLHARDPRIHFLLPRAASVEPLTLETGLRDAALPSLLGLDVLDGRSHEALCAADAVLAKPGTSTLEATLLERPLVVAARSSRLTAALLRRLVALDSFTMPNLLAGEAVVPEFLQEEARPERVADAVQQILEPGGAERQRLRLQGVRDGLSAGGAARRAAAIAAEMLSERLAS